MQPLNDLPPADGARILKPLNTPASALDKSLLGSVLARKPRGISGPSYGISPRIDSFAPKSPAEIVRWFEEFLTGFAPAPQRS